MNDVFGKLEKILDLTRTGQNTFTGESLPIGNPSTFGGQFIAQSLVAAGSSITDKTLHSLHSTFLLPGKPEEPVTYTVTTVFKGKRFEKNRVAASQNGTILFTLTASYQTEEEGFTHQNPVMPEVPSPEDLLSDFDLRERLKGKVAENILHRMNTGRAILFRPAEAGTLYHDTPEKPVRNVWFKPAGTITGGQEMHRIILAYSSDFWLVSTALLPHGKSFYSENITVASLDHAMWLHQDVDFNDWLLYSMESPRASGGRGLNRGYFFNRAGELVATVMQEGMIKYRGE
jgi:acyl-CoA thioesterase II